MEKRRVYIKTILMYIVLSAIGAWMLVYGIKEILDHDSLHVAIIGFIPIPFAEYIFPPVGVLLLVGGIVALVKTIKGDDLQVEDSLAEELDKLYINKPQKYEVRLEAIKRDGYRIYRNDGGKHKVIETQ